MEKYLSRYDSRTYLEDIDDRIRKNTCSINSGQELLNNVFLVSFQYPHESYANYLAKIQSGHKIKLLFKIQLSIGATNP